MVIIPQGHELIPDSVGFSICPWERHKLLVVKSFSLMMQQQHEGMREVWQ